MKRSGFLVTAGAALIAPLVPVAAPATILKPIGAETHLPWRVEWRQVEFSPSTFSEVKFEDIPISAIADEAIKKYGKKIIYSYPGIGYRWIFEHKTIVKSASIERAARRVLWDFGPYGLHLDVGDVLWFKGPHDRESPWSIWKYSDYVSNPKQNPQKMAWLVKYNG